ncbi:hypothetical protein [Limnochorda pilosa]|uniref:ABC transporter permease n=1 Tax=Limnochorda pilosa TaxID=1555112 RepID=A0A0K2SGD9_LIMPI|nr:hypothetical protein [Limnochorda pilosa]BAS26145.1 ABC transporter permease [Limnochorda pilosa]
MSRVLIYAAGIVVVLHGLIHLMGFVAYWPLAAVADLPYKTTLAGGRWDVGPLGMRVFSVLWLAAALGFLAAAIGLVTGQDWWRPALVSTVVLSTGLIALDWASAFRGAIVNAVIVAFLILTLVTPGVAPR